MFNNAHGKDSGASGAFRQGLLYSHHHGPYFYYAEVYFRVQLAASKDIPGPIQGGVFCENLRSVECLKLAHRHVISQE